MLSLKEHAHRNDTHSPCPDTFADVINSAEPYGHSADVEVTICLRVRLQNN